MKNNRKLISFFKASIPLILTLIFIEYYEPGLIHPWNVFNTIRGKYLNWQYVATLPAKPNAILGGAWDGRDKEMGWNYTGRHTILFVEAETKIYKIDYALEPKLSEVTRDEIFTNSTTDCGDIESLKHSNEVIGFDIFWCGEWDSGRDHYSILEDNTVWRGRIIGSSPHDFGLVMAVMCLIGPTGTLPMFLLLKYAIEFYSEEQKKQKILLRTKRRTPKVHLP